MQKNWIGRSEGLRFSFALKNAPVKSIDVFSTRQDTLFGASFIALSPDHPLTEQLAAKDPKIAAFVAECHKGGTAEETIETAEKLGYDTGIRALHPFDDSWELPVYVANFVLMAYGTGAIFGCPAHDQRDLDFARKYRLPVLPVVIPDGADPKTFTIGDEAYVGPGHLANSRFLDGLDRRGREGRGRAPIGSRGHRQAHGPLSPARLARVAAALLGLSDPRHPLRILRHRPGERERFADRAARRCSLRSSGQSARTSSDVEAHRRAPSAKARRCAKRTRSTPLSTRRGISRASPIRTPTIPSTAKRPTTGCRSINISAASSTRSCICSMRASSRARCTRAAT